MRVPSIKLRLSDHLLSWRRNIPTAHKRREDRIAQCGLASALGGRSQQQSVAHSHIWLGYKRSAPFQDLAAIIFVWNEMGHELQKWAGIACHRQNCRRSVGVDHQLPVNRDKALGISDFVRLVGYAIGVRLKFSGNKPCEGVSVRKWRNLPVERLLSVSLNRA